MTLRFNNIKLTYQLFRKDRKDTVAVLTLQRPKSANAFNAEMVREIIAALQDVATCDSCRALILRGAGKNFSAGGDLNWMKDSINLGFKQNADEVLELIKMFEALAKLRLPTIAIAHGTVYGGAVGLVACADFAIALDSARFCISEVKVGLIPATDLPYLARKIPQGQLRRAALSGRTFGAEEAKTWGLVQVVCSKEDLADVLRKELEGILSGSSDAQMSFKELLGKLGDNSLRQDICTAEALSKVRASETGQAGVVAFFEKKPPCWLISLSSDWVLDEAKDFD